MRGCTSRKTLNLRDLECWEAGIRFIRLSQMTVIGRRCNQCFNPSPKLPLASERHPLRIAELP